MRFLDLDIFFYYYYYLSTSLKTSKKWQRPFFLRQFFVLSVCNYVAILFFRHFLK